MRISRRELLYIGLIIVMAVQAFQQYYKKDYQPSHDIHVSYNQNIEANQIIIDTISNAERFVWFGIYTFTREDIKDALIGAKYRGLDVKGVTDKSQTNNSQQQKDIIEELRKAGIPVAMQDHSAIMHLKTLVTDKEFVSGSYNWTKAATISNDEVLEYGSDENVRSQYELLMNEVITRYLKSE